MSLSDLRRFLLGLIGPRADAKAAASFSEEDWAAANAMAAQHRLQPHLHARVARGELQIPIPDAVRGQWRESHRASGIRALAMRKALHDAHAILRGQGIDAIPLKGSWCAWHAYPAAAERPMRDIDLLLPPDHALAAFDALIDSGFGQESPGPRTPEQSLHHDKHLPPLLSSEGIRFELHMRLWERDEAIGWPMPQETSHAMLERARCYGPEDDTAYLAPEDMLAHFIIHGAYSNRLNGGPLALIDLAFLLQREAIDWPAVWQRSEKEGWTRGAALLLTLTDHWCSPGLLQRTNCPVSLDADLWAGAPDLLLQDLDQRKAVGMVSGLTSAFQAKGLSGGVSVISRRMRGGDRPAPSHEPANSANETFTAWFARRFGESARALIRRDVRKVAHETAKLGAWLDADV